MPKIVVQQPPAPGEWTPCWSAHAYGFDDAWWRRATMDGEDCRCSAEKIAHDREQGRLIVERQKEKQDG